MKKAIRILLAILLICLAALTVVACKPDDPVIDPQEQCKQNGHSWEMSAKYPTCDAEGKITYTCTVCGATDERVLPPTGNHSWDAGKETTPPTCGVEGVRTYTCTECGETRTEAIPATGEHKLGEHFVEVASTCEREGSREYWLCQDCGNKVDQDGNAVSDDALVIPKLSHVYEVTDVTEPTCEETGKITYTCTVCGKASFDKEIPATGHSYGRLVDGTEATCTTPGMQAYYHCDRCGKYFDADKRQTEYDDLVIDKLQHRWVEVEGKQATCTEEGLTDGVVCEQCGVWQQPQTSIPAKGHNEQPIPAVAATCTEGGLTEGVRCADCGKILVYPKHTAALGHSYVVDVSVGDEGWIWGDDFLSATLNFVCANVGCPQPHVSVDAEVEVSSDDPDHTAYKATARYQGNTYTKEHSVNHNHTEHTYTVVEWRWDGYTSASVVLRCTVGNEQQTVAAEVTKEETRRPTCAVEGLNTYTATAQGPDGKTYTDVKQETVAVTSHNYVITHEGDAFGQHHEQCSVCGDDKQPVSCTIVENHCTVCDYTYTDDEILTALFELAQKTELPGTYKLSGTVTSIDANANAIFDMQVGNRSIRGYHIVGEGVDKIAIGSQVTLVGTLERDNTLYRFNAGTLTAYTLPTLTIDSSITHGKFVGLPTSVNGRTTVEFTIEADAGYYVQSVKVDGKAIDPVDGKYTIDVYQNIEIEVVIVEGTQQSVDYTKLISEDLLQEGLQFIIVASDYDFAMKPYETGNNLKGIGITKNDDVITVVGDSVQVVVLEKGSLDNTWALKVGEKYLYAAGIGSTKNNYLKTTGDKKENGASWRITISSDGVATIVAQPNTEATEATHNVLRYNSNSNNGNLFACYTSGQSSVTLYYKPSGEIHIHKWVYKTPGSDWQHTKQCSECQESVTEPCSPVLNACACGKTYTAQEIVDKLYTLDPGEELPGTYELPGKVTKVSEQYNTQYKNSTFYMNVCGKDVQVYHVTGDATLLQSVKVGYTITVRGSLKRYTSGDVPYEFDSGCVLVSATPGGDTPTPQNVTLTVTNDTGKGTIEDDSGAALESGSRAKDTTIKFRITPQEGWEVDSVTVNGTAIQPDNGLYTVTLDKDTEIVVTYKSTSTGKEMVTLTVNHDGNHGTAVDEDGRALSGEYEKGTELKFRINANEGWVVDKVTVNESPVDPDESGLYTVTLNAATTILVTYRSRGGDTPTPQEDEWKLVTDVSELQDGDQIVIVGEYTPTNSDVTSYYALGNTQNKNNRKAISIEAPNADGTVNLNQNVQIITVHIIDGNYTFEVKDYFDKDGVLQTTPGYLCAAGKTGTDSKGKTTYNNYLRTQTTLTNDGKWTIEISPESYEAKIKAQGECDCNILRFNPSTANNILFACYHEDKYTNQKAVKIYKFVSEEEPAHEHVWTVGDNAVTWTADVNGATATLTFTCTAEGCTEEGGTITVNIPNDKITSVKKDATCQIEGSVTYSVSLTAADIEGLLDGKGGTVSVTDPVTSTKYIKTSDKTGHTAAEGAVWKVDNETGKHYHDCKYGCGNRVDEASHAAADNAEWKYDETTQKHYQECKDCGTHINQTGHEADKTAGWQSDAQGHYYKCKYDGCTERLEEAVHNFGTVYTPVNENGKDTHTRKCSECNYVETNDCTAKDVCVAKEDYVSLGADTHAKKCQYCGDPISSTVESHTFPEGGGNCQYCNEPKSGVTISWGSTSHNVNTLAEAIEYIQQNAPTEQVTIAVHADRQLPGFTVEASWNIVLDLQGHTYTATSPITVAPKATFAVVNGTITNSTNFGAAATVAVRRSARTIASEGNVLVDNQGTLTVFANAHIVFNGGKAEDTALNNSGEVTLQGTVSSEKGAATALNNEAQGEVTLQGTVSSESGTALNNEAEGTVTFDGSQAKATTQNGVALDNSGNLATSNKGAVSVEVTGTGADSSHAVGLKNSGTVDNNVQVNVTVQEDSAATGVELNGGTFKPSSDSTIDGSVVVDPAEGSDVTATLPDNFNGDVELKGDSTGDVNVTLPKDYQGDVTIDESSKLTCDQIAEGTGTLAHEWNVTPQWSEWTDKDTVSVTFTCNRCGAKETYKSTDVDSKVTITEGDKQDATCTEAGTQYYKATVTGPDGNSYTSDTQFEEEIPATGHKWNTTPQWTWTDEKTVSVKFTCDSCGTTETYNSTDVDNKVTITEGDKQNATCSDSGYQKYQATVTGPDNKQYKSDHTKTLDALGHNFEYSNAKTEKIDDNTHGVKCERFDQCGEWGNKSGHDWDNATVQSNNGASGHTIKCPDCDATTTDTHKLTAARPLQDGDADHFHEAYCTVSGCDYTERVEHDFGNEQEGRHDCDCGEPVCAEGTINITNSGSQNKNDFGFTGSYKDSNGQKDCNGVLIKGDNVIFGAGPVYFQMKKGGTSDSFDASKLYNVDKLPGGITSITITWKKSGSGKLNLVLKTADKEIVSETLTIENGNSANSKTVIDGTTMGKMSKYLNRDDYVYFELSSQSGSSYIDNIVITYAAGHHVSDGEWSTDKAPTCTENGIEVSKCIRCGETMSRTVNATGHSWTKEDASEATCKVPAYVAQWQCTSCRKYVQDSGIGQPALYLDDIAMSADKIVDDSVNGGKAYDHAKNAELLVSEWSEGVHQHICKYCPEDLAQYIPLDSDMDYEQNDDGSTHTAVCYICSFENDNEGCTAKDGWVSDETGHWRICQYCQWEIDGTREGHSFGTDDICDDCEYSNKIFEVTINGGETKTVGTFEDAFELIESEDAGGTIKLLKDSDYTVSGSKELNIISLGDLIIDTGSHKLIFSVAVTIESYANVELKGAYEFTSGLTVGECLTFTINGTVSGDVNITNSEVTIGNTVTGNVSVSGGKATISGAVTGNVILTGGTLTLNGATVGNINITVTKDTTVELIEEGESNLGTITIAVNDYVEGAKVQDLTVTLLKSQFKSDDAKESNYTIKSESVNCDDLSGVTFDGATKTPISHTYSDETDTTCDICGAEKETSYERKEIDELVKTAPTDTETYIVEGIWVHDNSKSELSDDQYGNGFLYDPSSGNRIEHYGMLKDEETFNSAIATWKSKNTFTNPKEFQSFRNQFEEGDKIELGVVYNSKYDNYYSFFIRRTEVKANIDYEATTDFNADGGTVTIDNASKLHYGEEVTINITTQDGYKVGSVKHNDTVINAADGVYKFTVVPGPNKISVNFVEDTVETEKYYVKINATSELVSGGKYLIVYESANIAYDGSNTQKEKSFAVSISSDRIKVDATTADKYFTITLTNTVYTIQSQSGYYIGNTNSTSNQTLWNTTTKYTNNITVSAGDADIQDATVGTKFRVNTKNNNQMRYFKAGTADGNPTQYVLVQLYLLQE